MPALWRIRAYDPKRQRTFFLRVWLPPPRLTAPLGLVRAGLFFFFVAARIIADRGDVIPAGGRRFVPGMYHRTNLELSAIG